MLNSLTSNILPPPTAISAHTIFLSIIIPCYNASSTIVHTLDCFTTQFDNFSNYEIIVIDDGSTDKTLAIVNEYCSRNNSVKVYHKTNGGVSSARNFGLKKALGTYIWYFDADDLLFDNSINVIVKHLEQNKPDILRFNSVTADRTVRQTIETYNNSQNYKILYQGNYSDYLKNSIISFACWSYIVKKSLLASNGIFFDETLSIHEDVLWGLTLAKHSPDAQLLYISLNTVKYSVRGDSIVNTVSSNANKKHLYATIQFGVILNDNSFQTCKYLRNSLINYRIDNERHLLTRHLSCKLNYSENKSLRQSIRAILSDNYSQYGKLYKILSYNILIFMGLQSFYRDLILPYIKPYISRN